MDITTLKKQLKSDEGVKYYIYLDHLENPTFGVGHFITRVDPEYGLPLRTPVSKERVLEVFRKDIKISIAETKRLYGEENFYSWPEEVRQVIVNMMFNMGRPRLSTFVNFRGAILERDWISAADHGRDSLWYRQVTNRAERLMSRLERVTEL